MRSQTDSPRRCPYRVRLRCLAQRPGQGRHHQEWSLDPVLANRSIPGLVETPSKHSQHIYRREFLGFWTSRTLQCALGCARSGAQVNLSIMVNIITHFSLGILSPMVRQYGFDDIARRILMTKVFPLGSGPDESRSKTGYGIILPHRYC